MQWRPLKKIQELTNLTEQEHNSLKHDVAHIEYILVKHFSPMFLNIERDGLNIQVVFSSVYFDKLSLERRIKLVYDVLLTHASDVLKNRLCVVQPFDTKEMMEAIDNLW